MWVVHGTEKHVVETCMDEAKMDEAWLKPINLYLFSPYISFACNDRCDNIQTLFCDKNELLQFCSSGTFIVIATSSLLCLYNNKYLKTVDLSVSIVILTSIDLPAYSQYTRLFPV